MVRHAGKRISSQRKYEKRDAERIEVILGGAGTAPQGIRHAVLDGLEQGRIRGAGGQHRTVPEDDLALRRILEEEVVRANAAVRDAARCEFG